jgi:hypothetical protein
MAAPKGNRFAAKDLEWRRQLKWALDEYESDEVQRGCALRDIARKVVGLALNGNIDAIHELGNRLDGKPAQAVHVTGDDEGGPIRAHWTVEIIRAATPDT